MCSKAKDQFIQISNQILGLNTEETQEGLKSVIKTMIEFLNFKKNTVKNG